MNQVAYLRRGWVPAWLLFLVFVGLGARLYYLQICDYAKWESRAERNTVRLFLMEPRRGDILDANGNPLTTSVPVKRVFANPRLIGPRYAETAQVLAPLVGWEEPQLAERLRPYIVRTNRLGQPITNAYVNLRRKVTFETWQQITQAMHRLTDYLVQREGNRKLTSGETWYYRGLRRSAIYAVDDYQREYTCNRLAAHVIGFAQDHEIEFSRKTVFEVVGRDGIEAWFDQKLTGMRGWRHTETDNNRKELLVYRDAYLEPKPGLNVELTLDMVVQDFVETALAEAVKKHTPESATAIVLRPRTGEILAMATWPNYDPNRPGEAPVAHRRNRAISDLIEPGSTFKIVTVSAALDQGVVTLNDVFDCERGRWRYLGKILKDHGGYDQLTVKEIVYKSSNIGAAKIALRLGEDRLYNYSRRYGFGEKTGITLGGEVRGIVHPPSNRDRLRVTRVAMGQAVSVTQLQMALAMATIANGGVRMRPLLVKGLRDQNGNYLVRYQPQTVGRVIRQRTAEQMLIALKATVSSEGTAPQAQLEHYTVAGKTGTAQVPGPGGYVAGEHVGSFIGFFPADQPEVLVLVSLVKPHNGYYGGTVAAPVFHRIAEHVAQYLKIRPDKEPPADPKAESKLVKVER